MALVHSHLSFSPSARVPYDTERAFIIAPTQEHVTPNIANKVRNVIMGVGYSLLGVYIENCCDVYEMQSLDKNTLVKVYTPKRKGHGFSYTVAGQEGKDAPFEEYQTIAKAISKIL